MIKTSDIALSAWLDLEKALMIESPRCAVSELCVLNYIIDHQRCSTKDIGLAIYNDSDSSSANMIVDRWEKRGIVEVRRGNYSKATNRAKTSIILTDKAISMLLGQAPLKLDAYIRNKKMASHLLACRPLGKFLKQEK